MSLPMSVSLNFTFLELHLNMFKECLLGLLAIIQIFYSFDLLSSVHCKLWYLALVFMQTWCLGCILNFIVVGRIFCVCTMPFYLSPPCVQVHSYCSDVEIIRSQVRTLQNLISGLCYLTNACPMDLFNSEPIYI